MPAKSGDQVARVGDVFTEITEKMLFPGFGFSSGEESALGRGRRRFPEK
jgi:hypothetical protein